MVTSSRDSEIGHVLEPGSARGDGFQDWLMINYIMMPSNNSAAGGKSLLSSGAKALASTDGKGCKPVSSAAGTFAKRLTPSPFFFEIPVSDPY